MLSALLCIAAVQLHAQVSVTLSPAAGETTDTPRLQAAIDSVSKAGGGTVILTAGNYVTGSVALRDNCELHLSAGALLHGSTNPYDYTGYTPGEAVDDSCLGEGRPGMFGLITALDVRNVSITGHGTIDGRGLDLALAIDSLHHTGRRIDPTYNTRRMRPTLRPKLLDLHDVDSLKIEGVNLRSSAAWGLSLNSCSNVLIDSITFVNRAYWNNDGIDVTDCRNVVIERCDINAADDGIVLKSFNPHGGNDNITVRDCRVCSSANALKLGTESFGGFRNISISNIYVYDTFRSAVALETVDGAILENVTVDSITAVNTGNSIFMRLGHRHGERPGTFRNVTVSNLSCVIPFGRPDERYDLRGPDINIIHNPFPGSITGIPGHPVENVTLRNIDITYPGRATKGMGYVAPYRYHTIPENEASYPEFHMFGELPAWAFFLRHVDGITFDNVTVRTSEPDYRPAVVAIDVSGMTGSVTVDNP